MLRERDAPLAAGKVKSAVIPPVPKPGIRLIPGMSMEMAQAAADKKAKDLVKATKKKEDKALAAITPVTVFTAPVVSDRKGEPMTAADADKKIRALRKKVISLTPSIAVNDIALYSYVCMHTFS
jgi:hypothetical protein